MTIGITPYSAPVNSQYHAQDKYGQYVYGYASGLSAKDEIKTADGVTRGGYSYIDANGILQTVQYISDPINGFRVVATNIPHDLPEVALAKARHFQAYENIKAEHAYISALQGQPVVAISPQPLRGSVVVPVSAARVEPVSYVPPVHYTPVPVSNQFHAQDNLGQYTYGYAGPLSSKTETKTADGITRGGYSYIDANGVLQNIQYVADSVHGFRVQATNLPEAPAVTLIGPKVTAAVVGPKEEPPVQPISIQPVAPPVNYAPIYHSVPAVSQPGSTFVDPIVVSDGHDTVSINNRPTLVNFPASQPVDHSYDSPILTSPPALTNSVHNVPFPSNGQIVAHTDPSLLSNLHPIGTLNIPQDLPLGNVPIINHDHSIVTNLHPAGPQANHNLLSNVHHDGINNFNIQPAPILNPVHNVPYPSNGQIVTQRGPSFSPNEYIPAIQIENVHDIPIKDHARYAEPNHAILQKTYAPNNVPLQNPDLVSVSPQQFSDFNVPTVTHNHNPTYAIDFNAQNANNLLLNTPPNPNYQIPVNAALPNVAISKDLINSVPINQGPLSVYQEASVQGGPFYEEGVNRGALGETVYESSVGSIPDGLPVGGFIPRQHHVQQVQQTPVSVVQPAEQQPLFHKEQERIAPASPIALQHGTANGPDIQGPTGYYTTNVQY